MHRLAMGLGGRTVEELMQVIRPGEYVRWMKFYAEEPWGAPWLDGLFAKQTVHLLSIWTKARLKVSQFLYKGPQQRKQKEEHETEKVFNKIWDMGDK